MAQDSNRRHQPRAPIELKVEYKRLNTFFHDYTKNISKGGTFIATSKPLPLGTMFLFKLMVPSLDEPITLRGEVRWVVNEGETPPSDLGADHPAGMGIRFIYDGDEQRDTIERTVEGMMIESLGQVIYSRLLGGGTSE